MIYVCERKDRAVTKVCDNCDCGMVIPMTQSADSAVREAQSALQQSLSELKRLAIRTHVRLAPCGGEVFNGLSCMVCGAQSDDENLTHKPGCIVRLASPEAPAAVDETRICRDGREFVIELATIMGVVDVTADAGEPVHVSKIMPLMLARAKEDRERWHDAPMPEDQIKHMVNRFLGWRLPENFNPDNGISFTPFYNEHRHAPSKREPSGTNLFDATQADAMVRYMVEGLTTPPAPQGTTTRYFVEPGHNGSWNVMENIHTTKLKSPWVKQCDAEAEAARLNREHPTIASPQPDREVVIELQEIFEVLEYAGESGRCVYCGHDPDRSHRDQCRVKDGIDILNRGKSNAGL